MSVGSVVYALAKNHVIPYATRELCTEEYTKKLYDYSTTFTTKLDDRLKVLAINNFKFQVKPIQCSLDEENQFIRFIDVPVNKDNQNFETFNITVINNWDVLTFRVRSGSNINAFDIGKYGECANDLNTLFKELAKCVAEVGNCKIAITLSDSNEPLGSLEEAIRKLPNSTYSIISKDLLTAKQLEIITQELHDVAYKVQSHENHVEIEITNHPFSLYSFNANNVGHSDPVTQSKKIILNALNQ